MIRPPSSLVVQSVAICLFLLLSTQEVEGFGNLFSSKKATSSSPKSSAAAEKAVCIYDKNFPFDQVGQPAKGKFTDAYVKWGVPQRDIDGTPVFSGKNPKKRATDITKSEAVATFNELAKVYGEDRAVKMVGTYLVFLLLLHCR